MRTIQLIVPDLEVYSINECWADLTGMPGDLEALGREIQARAHRWVGIPVNVGIPMTKTLAKLAQWADKTWCATGGVVDLTDSLRQGRLLPLAPVGNVWSVGLKLTTRLHGLGITTARTWLGRIGECYARNSPASWSGLPGSSAASRGCVCTRRRR